MALATRSSSLTLTPERPDAFMGVAAGLVAGLAYLGAQMLLALVAGQGHGWEPLERIAAILLGPDAAPPSDFNFTVIGMALLIHLPLSAVYGRAVAIVASSTTAAGAAWRGGVLGLAIYAANFWLIAPVAFPWFEQSRQLGTACDHLLFGMLAGLLYSQLVRLRRQA